MLLQVQFCFFACVLQVLLPLLAGARAGAF